MLVMTSELRFVSAFLLLYHIKTFSLNFFFNFCLQNIVSFSEIKNLDAFLKRVNRGATLKCPVAKSSPASKQTPRMLENQKT